MIGIWWYVSLELVEGGLIGVVNSSFNSSVTRWWS